MNNRNNFDGEFDYRVDTHDIDDIDPALYETAIELITECSNKLESKASFNFSVNDYDDDNYNHALYCADTDCGNDCVLHCFYDEQNTLTYEITGPVFCSPTINIDNIIELLVTEILN